MPAPRKYPDEIRVLAKILLRHERGREGCCGAAVLRGRWGIARTGFSAVGCQLAVQLFSVGGQAVPLQDQSGWVPVTAARARGLGRAQRPCSQNSSRTTILMDPGPDQRQPRSRARRLQIPATVWSYRVVVPQIFTQHPAQLTLIPHHCPIQTEKMV